MAAEPQVLEEVSKIAGRLGNFVEEWKKLNPSPTILNWIKGYKIPIMSAFPNQDTSFNTKISIIDKINIDKAIQNLLMQGAIVPCQFKSNQFLSPFFLVEKQNGKKRFILNLKRLNMYIKADHFKMEDFRTVTKLVQRNCYMASVDLKDAYFLVPVHRNSRKYLRFSFENVLYEFTCLPFGLSTAPYVFTKIMKPVVSSFRLKGISCVVYLDDFLIFGDTRSKCESNVQIVLNTLQSLGFIINWEKSCLIPETRCKFLGFVFDSRNMSIELPLEKRNRILELINVIKRLLTCKIRYFAHFIGLLVSAVPAVKYGMLYIKNFERQKFGALLKSSQNYNAPMLINHSKIKEDLDWWSKNIPHAIDDIRQDTFDIEIYTDASSTGWGAYCQELTAQGWWDREEKTKHINFLELLAIFYGLKCFVNNLSSCNVLIRVDNSTALSYVNRMGSIKHENLSLLTRDIWRWCEVRDIWLRASYIPSKSNLADKSSRIISLETEWELNSHFFETIVNQFGQPDIDLFASNINNKCENYISWSIDPGSIAVDAFTVFWGAFYFYAFPPFSLILRVLKKIITDKARGILVVPYWPSQAWYPLFLKLTTEKPMFIGPNVNLLSSPFRDIHPLSKTLILVAGKLYGVPTE